MAFLPAELAFQVTISVYIFVGSLGVLVWDILNNLQEDYKLFFKHRVRIPTVIYLISRLVTLAFVLSSTIYETAPVDISCRLFNKVVDWLFTLSVSSTSLLFLIRIIAIFDRNKWVIVFFIFMWLSVVAGVLASTQGVLGAKIGPTRYCINVSMESYVSAGSIIPLVNDTFVFLAISWKLMKNSAISRPRIGKIKAFFRGHYLPAFSKGLLQDGQVYYLTTVSTNLLTVVVFFLKTVPVVYRTMFVVPNVMLMNIMACRVFRRTKFGLYREKTSINTSGVNSKSNDTIIPLSFISNSHPNGRLGRGRSNTIGGIEVTKTVEQRTDGLGQKSPAYGPHDDVSTFA
ncbi:hypothetical protein NLJ89_g3893 [Agrocybe chaxingu]|uniref:Uncharacterized protein n=1 Tax=Agrocybe chaxingu TaxID=84603 RepID=A0A9W8MWF9_9AGAR|nr:hypothetical protein NLJ89_g3893 [Agrocybe chaxingu]